MNSVTHQLFDCLRFLGLRDRLRCPHCKSIGTWKPHGGWFDKEDVRKVRRWMCKWCGSYIGPEGESDVVPSPDKGCWVFLHEYPEGLTPQQALLHNRHTEKCWPWRG